MKNLIRLSFIAVLFFSLASFTADLVQSWNVDKAHSSVSFSVNHFFTPVNGWFDEYDGTFLFDPDRLAESKADFTIKVASVRTQDTKRDNHLQSEDFFNAEKYPYIHFVSTSFEKKEGQNYVAHGKLTIRDVTTEFSLPFTVLGVTEHPMMKGTMLMGIQAEAKFNRNDYDVGSGSWAATMIVGDEVNIKIILEANHK